MSSILCSSSNDYISAVSDNSHQAVYLSFFIQLMQAVILPDKGYHLPFRGKETKAERVIKQRAMHQTGAFMLLKFTSVT